MNDTERYLRGATRGLWGKEKQALQMELEGHIHIRNKELMLTGLNDTEAERQTLRELGAPTEVSRGMAGVYALNTAVKSTLVTSLLACTALLSVQQVRAQVQGVYDMPQSHHAAGAYLDFDQLKQEVKNAGGEITGEKKQQLMLHLPSARRPDFSLYADDNNLFTRDGRTYFSADAFLATLLYMGTQVQIQGWNNPKITVGKNEIQLRTTDWRVLNSLYAAPLHRDFQRSSKLTAGDTMILVPFEPNGAGVDVNVQNNHIQQGHIYALVVPQFNAWSMTRGVGKTGGTILLVSNVVQATRNGQAQFRAYSNTVPFKIVQSEAALHRALEPYQGKLSGWNEKTPAPALLLELTGKFGHDAYKVLPPQ